MHIKLLLCVYGQTLRSHKSAQLYWSHQCDLHEPQTQPSAFGLITMVFGATRGVFIPFICLYKLRVSLEGSVLLSSAALSHSDSSLGYLGPLQGTVWVPVVCLSLHSASFLPSVVSVCLSFATVIENWAVTERDEQVWASNTLYIYVLSPANVKFALCGHKQKQTAFL